VTDIHHGTDKVVQLKERLGREKHKFDVVLISGDVANFPADKYYKGDKELESEHHDILLKITAEFVSVAERVYFIPGNVRGSYSRAEFCTECLKTLLIVPNWYHCVYWLIIQYRLPKVLCLENSSATHESSLWHRFHPNQRDYENVHRV
jgi:hypothetical protein